MEGEDIENDATWKRLKDVIQVIEERGRWIEAEDALEEDVMMMGGAGDDGDERIDMTEAENNCKMTEGDNEVDIDGMLNECQDGRVGEKSKDDGMVDDAHDDQGGRGTKFNEGRSMESKEEGMSGAVDEGITKRKRLHEGVGSERGDYGEGQMPGGWAPSLKYIIEKKNKESGTFNGGVNYKNTAMN